MMDDNVRVWKAQRIGADDGFFATLPYQLECSKLGREGPNKDVPLRVVRSPNPLSRLEMGRKR